MSLIRSEEQVSLTRSIVPALQVSLIRSNMQVSFIGSRAKDPSGYK